MTTHKEEIDVPDGFTVKGMIGWGYQSGQDYGCITFNLKPLPPPEPEIKPCPFCGGNLTVAIEGTKWVVCHQKMPWNCIAHYSVDAFESRLAAIEAANRRAP